MFRLTETLTQLHTKAEMGKIFGILKTCSKCNSCLTVSGFFLVCAKDENHDSAINLKDYLAEIEIFERMRALITRAREIGFIPRCSLCSSESILVGINYNCPVKHESVGIFNMLSQYETYYYDLLVNHARVAELQSRGFDLICKKCGTFLEAKGSMVICPNYNKIDKHARISFNRYFEQYLVFENRIQNLQRRIPEMANCGFIRNCKICNSTLVQSKSILICPKDISHGIVRLKKLEREFSRFAKGWEKKICTQSCENFEMLCEHCPNALSFYSGKREKQKACFQCNRCWKNPSLTYERYYKMLIIQKVK